MIDEISFANEQSSTISTTDHLLVSVTLHVSSELENVSTFLLATIPLALDFDVPKLGVASASWPFLIFKALFQYIDMITGVLDEFADFPEWLFASIPIAEVITSGMWNDVAVFGIWLTIWKWDSVFESQTERLQSSVISVIVKVSEKVSIVTGFIFAEIPKALLVFYDSKFLVLINAEDLSAYRLRLNDREHGCHM